MITIERPPLLLRIYMHGATFRMPRQAGDRSVYLTFDDGPIPEATPRVLSCLRSYGAKATFFMVGDNARRHPDLVKQVLAEGHAIGNHTMHHTKGLCTSLAGYLADVDMAEPLLPGASRLFRPPRGLMRPRQLRTMLARGRVVLYDVLTRDYSPRVDARCIVRTVRRLTRPGSVIVFHDSLRSIDKLITALPTILEFLAEEGYTLRTL